MTTSTEETNGPIAVAYLPRKDGALITYAKAMLAAWTNNPNFPNPDPTLVVFAADIAAYEDAATKAASRTKGAVQLRNAKRRKVKDDIYHLCDYAQGVSETQASVADAIAVILSGYLSVRKTGSRTKPPLAVTNLAIQGEVLADAKAVAATATYFWQFSLDQKNWTSVPETMKSKTTITGLTSAQTYYFRFRAVTRKGPVDWSQIVALLVH